MRQSIALLALVSATGTASAQITLQVFPSPAPNFFGSPSWAGYRDNAIESLEAGGGGNIGSRVSDPTAYETGTSFQVHDFIATNYNMWLGNTGLGAPLNNELGHRMHFGLRAVAQVGTQFALEDVAITMTSSDSGNGFGFSEPAGGWGSYSASRVGVLRGPDGIVGTGDDTFITSGPSTQLVDALYYVGVGNADESLINATTYSSGSPYPYTNTPNPALAYSESAGGFSGEFGPGWSLSTTYTINGFSGTGTATLIPAPGALAALGLGGLLAARRRRA